MEQLLEVIRLATAADASPDARTAGAQACRMVIAHLEPQPTAPAEQPLAVPIAQLATAIRTIPMDQLLDLAISKLRTVLPAGTEAPAVAPLKFPLIPVRRS